MTDLGGGMAVENGFYTIRWYAKADPAGDTGGGKSVNLWNKDENRTWKLFRQDFNHD
ncbi:hypothetical protein [uncultured Chitinophaga sp.]|uniref:hypothetical protein n=1 Tax=uncultured Chitinophaga sp. TaxID=339340 RepID=UPI002601AA6A|nr:hypothetical protein [uncultured Chitinophaga sp.]